MKKETLKYASIQDLKVFARTFIKHKESHVHEINNYIISKQMDFYAVVNINTLDIKAFDFENKAVDFILDTHNSNGKQKELF